MVAIKKIKVKNLYLCKKNHAGVFKQKWHLNYPIIQYIEYNKLKESMCLIYTVFLLFYYTFCQITNALFQFLGRGRKFIVFFKVIFNNQVHFFKTFMSLNINLIIFYKIKVILNRIHFKKTAKTQNCTDALCFC